MSEGIMASSVLNVGDFLSREQAIGALSQLRLHQELFGRLFAQVNAEINTRETKKK